MKNKKEQNKTRSTVNIPAPKREKADEKNYSPWLFSILLLVIISYLPSLHNGFVWDDQDYIFKNNLLPAFDLQGIFSGFVMGNYHPLTILVYAIEFHFFGLDATGYHVLNLILHLLNVVMVFEVVFLVSGKNIIALVTAFLFGIHPMHVESVAWISELKDVLYTFFFLASYLYYLKYLVNHGRKYYFISILLFLFSITSKAMAASLPLVLLLTDLLKDKKINSKAIADKLPYFIISIVFGLVAITAQHSAGATDVTVFPVLQRVCFASYNFIGYLLKLIIPLNLSAFYAYPIKPGENLPAQFYLYPLLLSVFFVWIFYTLRNTKKIFFAMGFYTVTIFLVLQLMPVGGSMMSDRYSYISSIGLFYLAGEGFYRLWKSSSYKMMARVLICLFAIFLSVKTYATCKIWKDGISLWSNVIETNDRLPMVYVNRGSILFEKGRYQEALADLDKAIEIEPGFAGAYDSRGNVYLKLNEFEKALSDYSHSIKLKPENSNAYINRGNLLMSTQKYGEAILDFTSAIKLQPEFAEAYSNRGSLYGVLNKYDEAINDLNKAIELQPNFAKSYNNRGILWKNIKKYNEAVADFTKAIALQPDYAKAYYYRGLIYYEQGKKDLACKDLQQAGGSGFQQAIDSYNSLCK